MELQQNLKKIERTFNGETKTGYIYTKPFLVLHLESNESCLETKHKVQVSISLEHAKDLLVRLERSIASHEKIQQQDSFSLFYTELKEVACIAIGERFDANETK